MNTTVHTLYICTTCKKRDAHDIVIDHKAGEEFYTAMQNAFKTWGYKDQFTLVPVECLSACKKACAFAFQAPSKFSYVFGNTDDTMINDLLEMAEIYMSKNDGILKKIHRPEIFRDKVLARIPPLRS
ncbi:MAG: DUF1636 domain-containing protein [Alphaproteobacteria bacterium]|nr:DUF1636 domain-containing protein [Alphaproteobacteria bacterium]